MIQTQQEEVSQFLQPYVDGELSDDERMRVTESLESSDSARSYVRTQTEVRDLLRSLSRLEAPNELHARIRGALDEADEAQSAVAPPWRAITGRRHPFERCPAAAAGCTFRRGPGHW